MKKKETEIATNVSSGAEKVKSIEKEIKQTRKDGDKKKTETVKTVSAKGDAALGDSTPKKAVSKAERESEAAKRRVQLAIQKKEMEAKRKEEKEKKRAERVAAREQKIRERAHQKANRREAKAQRRKGRESREKGYGGWIAAVVALGVTTLALGTITTVGAVEMRNMKQGTMSANKGTMYELTGIMEHVDDDLDRVRISASSVQQQRILTDLLVQARVAAADLEKLPIALQEEENITRFINRTAFECERMLAKLRNGGALTERDMQALESLYEVNHSIRQELDQLSEKMTDKDLMAYMKGKEGMLKETLHRLQEMTLEENHNVHPNPMPLPTTEESAATIDGAQAVERCKNYFSKYNIQEFQCVGETSTKAYSAYNVQGYDEKGTMLFAEIRKTDGALIGFDYYEECSEERFDMENAERIAEEFLETLGYEDMEVVRFRGMGSTTEFTFVYEDDDVVYYPDEIRVKVCRTRGVVTGMDATKYLQNHGGMVEVNTKISLESAYDKLSEKLTVESSRLAVVNTARGKRAAYEFLCSYNDAKYFVYLDAETGHELAIINVQNVM